MARRFLVPIDLTKNELLNPRIHQLAAPPSSPVSGQLYYDTSANRLYYYNGTGWIAADATSITFATPTIALGTAAAAGAAGTVIRSDATIVAFDATAPSAQAIGDAAAVGTAPVAARRDHKHSMPSFGTIGASAVGDTVSDGVAGTVARSDHRHAREGFGAVTSETSFGASANNGAASTLARSDHRHGTPDHTGAAHSSVPITALGVPLTDLIMANRKITGLADPTAAQDAATKAYVDATVQGLDIKPSVRVATTTNVTLSGNQTIDNTSVSAPDRILVKNQTNPAENGIYEIIDAFSPWVRAQDANTSAEVNPGMFVFVEEGTTQADTGWVLTSKAPITLGTTSLTFAQFSGAGAYTAGSGLTQAGTTFNVGPGNGVLVAPDYVEIDKTVVVQKYATSVGNGSATSFVVTHNLNTQDVTVAIRENASPFAFVDCDIEATSVNTVTVRFTTAPTSNQFRVICHA